MRFKNGGADIYVPDGVEAVKALSRVTHLAIGAHQDDLEIMAYHGIAQCYDADDRWFAGITCTNGGGSPRSGPFAGYSDEQMQGVRRQEQRLAAAIGRYAAVIQLDYSSASIKGPRRQDLIEDLKQVFSHCKPSFVYIHNPADKHDTHIAVMTAAIQALQAVRPEVQPSKVLGCEVWRDLDWALDEDKVALDVSGNEHLQAALLGVYNSQIAGGKRYDLAILGRRRANATFFQSHSLDQATALTYALDLTPLLKDRRLEIGTLVQTLLERFTADVLEKLAKVRS